MLAGVDDRRSRHDVDRARRRARAGLDHPPVHGAARQDAGRRRARGRPARRRRRRRDRAGCARSVPSVTSAPGRSSERAQRRARSWRSRTREIGERDEGAAPLLHRRRGDRRGHEHRRRQHHGQLPAPARAARRDGRRSAATSGPASTMASRRRWRSGTTLGLRAGRTSQKMSLPNRSPGSHRSRSRKRAISVESATTELTRLPGLEVAETKSEVKPEHWIERGPSKRLMLFSGRSHPAARAEDRREARHPGGRRLAAHVRQTARRTAATRSRSAAPTSSSSSRARRPSTST